METAGQLGWSRTLGRILSVFSQPIRSSEGKMNLLKLACLSLTVKSAVGILARSVDYEKLASSFIG
jgi:hypothetical protein